MEQILELLRGVEHPDQGRDIVSMGMVEGLSVHSDRISFTLRMPKSHDPASGILRRAAERAISAATGIVPSIIVADPAPVNRAEQQRQDLRKNTSTHGVRRIVAISSGKGGVGKSSVTANLAVQLCKMGYRVGVLDADIYGPSMGRMFGVDGFQPPASEEKDLSGNILIEPAESYGVKVMSIGFFINSSDALVWRGPMATSALRQLIHQTRWGCLDFLLIDMPPGTGDIHLTVVGELKIDEAIIVTTPQMVALSDVVRGISMFRSEHVSVPVRGLVENMAYFEPSDGAGKRYYIFGEGQVSRVASEVGVEVLCSLPLVEGLAAEMDNGRPVACDSDLFLPLASSLL